MNDKEEHGDLESSSGVNQPPSDDDDDDDNDQDEEDLDENDDGEDDDEENSALNKLGSMHGIHHLHARQNSTSDPSSPPPAKRNRSELARFYEAAVKGRSLRSSAPGGIGQGNSYI